MAIGETMKKNVSLLVASPSTLVVHGAIALARTLEGVEVVGSARTSGELIQALFEHPPDVLIVDASLIPPVQALLGNEHWYPRTLVLGKRLHIGTRPAFGPHSVCGYVNERDSSADVPGLLETVTACPAPRAGGDICRSCPVQHTLKLPALPLSEREYDIFVRIGYGEGATQMAKELAVSVKTIESHRESIKRKLKLRSARALLDAASAWRYGQFLAGKRV